MAKKTLAQAAKKTASKTGSAKRRAAKQAPGAEAANPPVVGIGASAGGLEAFTQLLNALPMDTGLAFVLVQHLEPTHKSVLTPLLARATRMPVEEVREGVHVEPNHVYVIPANADLSLLDGLLHIVGRRAPAGRHLPIDYFLTSLAQSRGAQAIGVILSGTASDGTAGIKAIKEAGGITFAQDPESAKFDGMPRNAIGSGCVDLVLPPERIAKELARIIRHPFAGLLSINAVPSVPGEEEDWTRLFRILRTSSGVDFSLYKKSTIKRRLARRMAVCKADKLRTYVKLLETNHAEAEALFEELLILVTEFFRDPDVFAVLEQKIFPKILEQKAPGEAIRIWVAGCSTGEEAYSIAISLLQGLGEKASSSQIQIFGTDVSEKAIDKARVGLYSAADVKQIPAPRLRRFFTPVNGGFRVNEAVRELCVFARHDLTRDPPFSKLDMISCRNVLIYMEPPLQKRILASFHYGLRPNGILLLGKSESLGSYGDLFTAKDRKTKFFKKTEGAHVPVTFVQPIGEHAVAARAAKEIAANFDLEREAAQMVWERYGHAGLVVNGDLQIIHFLGDTSSYVRHAPGRASLQLMRSLRDEFVLEVRSALQKVRRGEALVRREGIEFRRNGHMAEVTVEVRPLMRNGHERSYLILFEQTGLRSDPAVKAGAPRAKSGRVAEKDSKKSRDREVDHLREELGRTRDYVQAIIRDQEATNEELKTANEEALSSMEELQSTNEELETAKEELQSSNEELVTLNEQLQNRNSELAQLTTDLGNVLTGIDIPIVILGVDRRIRRFTPPAERLLGLIAGDIGRPIGNLRIGVNVPDLDSLIALAIEKGVQSSREVQSEKEAWYSLRVRPFVGDDKVQGVLMAFIDITELKKLQENDSARANVSEATVHAVMDSAGQAILVVDRDSRIVLANATSEKMFGYGRDVLLGQRVDKLLPERLRAPYVRHSASWFKRPQNLSGLELAGLRADATEFAVQVNLSSIVTDGETRGVAFVSDITERRKTEQRLAVEVAALERLRRTNDELWRCHDMKTGLEQMIDAGIALLGADMGNIQLLNPKTHMLEIAAQRGFGPDFLDHFREVSAEEASACGRSLRDKHRIIIEDVELDPAYAPHRAVAAAAGYRAVQSTPLMDENGTPMGMFSTHFRGPHRPSDLELERFDFYASRTAQFIERLRSEDR
jgi:two-component system, chemotaxis family, CheB/CheR fusion protein